MKKAEKQKYMELETVAYYSGCGGIEIKDILNGIENHVVFVAGAWCGNPTVHMAKIYYTDNPYFRYHGYTIHLDDCLRTHI